MMESAETVANDEEDMKSDGSDDEEDKAFSAQLEALNSRLETNPEDYDAYVEKISLLRSAGELDDLTSTRRRFAKVFPLTPKIWLEWIADEQRLVSTDEDAAKVYELFELAMKDYVSSVDLWLEYCQFSLREIGSEDGVAKARETFERAIAACGLNVAKGSLVWETYREFESALRSFNSSDEAAASRQSAKIDALFRRQLAVPLLDMAATFEEYTSWQNGKEIDANVKNRYAEALKMLKPREELELRLMDLDEKEKDLKDSEKDFQSRLSIFSDYLAIEFQGRNPPRLQCLYERRITELCLHPHVWLKYLEFADRDIKLKNVSLPTYERAVRNIPNCAELWIKYMRALERFEEPLEIVKGIFDKAITKNFCPDSTRYRDLWLTYIDFYKRNTSFKDEAGDVDEGKRDELRNIFSNAVQHLSSLGIIESDPNFVVSKYRASLEADRFRSMDEARKIWSSIVDLVGDQAKHWLDYVQLEQLNGDFKHLRRLFLRALERTQDDPQLVADAWLQFEREEGSLSHFEECENKINFRMKKWNASREKEFAKGMEAKKEKQQKSSKRKREEHLTVEKEEPVFKKPMPAPPKPKVAPPPGFQKDGPQEKVAPPPGYHPSEQQPISPSEQKCTVFLSNLDFGTTEDEIKNAFKSSGDVVEVRLVKNYAGKSKGFGYLKFVKEEGALHALKRDHELLRNRPVFVSEFKAEKSSSEDAAGARLKFSTGMELNKLFVKGLSFGTKKEDIEKLFSRFGTIREVRLVTYRNGHSKGLAYVDYDKSESASRALLKTDGTVFDGKTISVAISNPPARRENPAAASENVKSLGGTSRENLSGPRGKGRSQVAFVPRAVRSAPAANGSAQPAAKSNADFRNMLLEKK